jgi:ribosomal protein S18 acetylase RimI-like enzyme
MVRIRAGRLADAAPAARIERSVSAVPGLLVAQASELPAAYERRLIALAQARHGVYLVAEDNRKLVGFASLRPMDLIATAHVYRLSIVVALSHVGRGIGKRLMRDLLARARRMRRILKVELLVRASNIRARRLYESFGFRTEGRLRYRVCLPDGSFMDDLSMAWFPRKMPANNLVQPTRQKRRAADQER